MKKLLSLFLVACMCFSVCSALASCGSHEHSFKAEWAYDDANHWHACEGKSCTETSELAPHTWNDGVVANGVKTVTCTICGKTVTENVNSDGGSTETVIASQFYGFNADLATLSFHAIDNKGRLVEVWDVVDFVSWRYEEIAPMISFVYNADGKITGMGRYAESYQIVYDQNGAPALAGVTDLSVAIEYHANGSVKKLTFSEDGETEGISFDDKGRFDSIFFSYFSGGVLVNAAYEYTYEGNNVNVALMFNGEPYPGSMTMQFNDAGLPVRETVYTNGIVRETVDWFFDGDRLMETIVVYVGDSAEKTAFIYDENGLLVKSELFVDGEPEGYTVYTNGEDGKRLSAYYYDIDGTFVEGSSYTYKLDGTLETIAYEKASEDNAHYKEVIDAATGRRLSELMTDIWVDDSSGEEITYYYEDYRTYDEEDRLLLHTMTTYRDVDGVKTKCDVNSYRYNYEGDASGKYDFVQINSWTYYMDAPDNHIDMDRYYYYKYTSDPSYYGKEAYQVNEATGEALPTSYDKYTDNYGNYYEYKNGNVGNVIYYQKYCDSNGQFWYFTQEGVRTPLS